MTKLDDQLDKLDDKLNDMQRDNCENYSEIKELLHNLDKKLEVHTAVDNKNFEDIQKKFSITNKVFLVLGALLVSGGFLSAETIKNLISMLG